MNNKDMPTYPTKIQVIGRDAETGSWVEGEGKLNIGLTKLEAFTMAALQGLCANPDLTHTPEVDLGYKAVVYAEATLAELERQNKQPVERDRP